MPKLIYILLATAVVLVMSCKKDLPPLPVTGTQGTFCWEQFQNNSFDPVSEWIDTSPNDFPECPTQNIDSKQVNDHRYDMQFAKNNPNILYYVLKKCTDTSCNQSTYHIAKYDFCSNKEEIIFSNISSNISYDLGNSQYLLHIGNEGEVFFPTGNYHNNQGVLEEIYNYSTNDMSTTIIDTGLNSTLNSFNYSLIPNENKIVYNMMLSGGNKNIAIFDLINNTYDTITHLEDYLNFQFYNPTTWLISKKDFSDGLFIYNPFDQTVSSVSSVQNQSPYSSSGGQKRLIYTNDKTFAFSDLRIESYDNNNGSNQVYFLKDNYNNIIINNLCISPDEIHLVANVTHQKWISNCDYEDRQYILVIDTQTGDWKALDFAQ